MINPKNICICSCIGFFLSFFIGILSDVHFSQVLLRAFLFALLFAGLCIGISFIYAKFLSVDSGAFSPEPVDAGTQKAAGGIVNIVVDDEKLADDGPVPKFTVYGKHSDLSSPAVSEPVSAQDTAGNPPREELSKAESVASPSESTESFKPMGLGSVAQSEGGGNAGMVAAGGSAGAVASVSHGDGGVAASPNSSGQLDELPDIGGMSFESSSDSTASESDSSDEVISDTEFATGGAKLKEQPISGDTSVMAKAIQTLLAKDN